jgi:hypothetical protein
MLAVDDYDGKSLARETLADQRPGYAAANNQRIALYVLANTGDGRPVSSRGPRRASAAQICLFGTLWVKLIDDRPQ